MASTSDVFRFDAEDSEDEFDGNDPHALHGAPEEAMRLDWGEQEFSVGLLDDGLESVPVVLPLDSEGCGLVNEMVSAAAGEDAGHDLGAKEWKARAESALVAKTSRDALTLLAAAPEAELATELRDKLVQRVSDADVFGTRALATLRLRPQLPELQALLAKGLALGVETRELVSVQQCVRQAQELQNRLAAFEMCEEQMDLRGLKGILNEMERLPVVLPEEHAVRERWQQSNAWLERARTVLSNPRRTRQGKQSGEHAEGTRQRSNLADLEALLQEGAALPLVCDRMELRGLSELLEGFKVWREEARAQLAAVALDQQAQGEQPAHDALPTAQQAGNEEGKHGEDDVMLVDGEGNPHAGLSPALGRQQQVRAEREKVLHQLVDRGLDFSIVNEEAGGLALLLWICRAEGATTGKTSLKVPCCGAFALSARACSVCAWRGGHWGRRCLGFCGCCGCCGSQGA
jgi:hypothetical protein